MAAPLAARALPLAPAAVTCWRCGTWHPAPAWPHPPERWNRLVLSKERALSVYTCRMCWRRREALCALLKHENAAAAARRRELHQARQVATPARRYTGSTPTPRKPVPVERLKAWAIDCLVARHAGPLRRASRSKSRLNARRESDPVAWPVSPADFP